MRGSGFTRVLAALARSLPEAYEIAWFGVGDRASPPGLPDIAFYGCPLALDNPQTGEHVWIQSDEAVMNSSNVPGGPQVGNAWILADAWNPKGFGSHSLQFTADTHSLSNYPRFEANQNNGKSWPNDQNYPPVVAHQTIFLGGTDASSIIVPEVAGTAGQ